MIEKASSIAAYGGGTTAFVFGLTPGEWQVVGIVGGLLIGGAGLLVNAWFQWKRFQRGDR